MHPARGRADGRRDILQKRDHIVIGSLLDLRDLRNRKPRAFPDFLRIGSRNLSQGRHRLAGQRLDLEPDFEFPLFRPQLAHLRAGVTLDHASKIKAGLRSESVLYARKRRGRSGPAALSEIQQKVARCVLADASARETSIALNAHLPTAEQISNSGDGFLGALGARADGQDQVTEGESLAILQDLSVFFHGVVVLESKHGASVQREMSCWELSQAPAAAGPNRRKNADTCVSKLNAPLTRGDVRSGASSAG